MAVSIYCPYCHKYTELSERGAYNTSQYLYWMGQCNACHKVVLVLSSRQTKHVVQIYPNPLPKLVDSRIPASIKNDFEEALECFSLSAFRSAGVMSRRALQCCCLDKGANENQRLVDQIEWLFTQGVLTKDLKDWAHEVRLTGNDAAHPQKPGEDTLVTEEDAKDILELLEQFTNVLYVAPAIAEERRKFREQKKKDGEES